MAAKLPICLFLLLCLAIVPVLANDLEQQHDLSSLPHAHRHQEHYAAVQRQRERDKNVTASTSAPANNKSQQRLEQLQQAVHATTSSAAVLLPRHHHLRHEQHLRAELEANRQQSLGLGPGQQHHLRHHNRHHAAWEQRLLPALRHLSSSSSSTTTTTDAPLPSFLNSNQQHASVGNLSTTRYFDRDGIYAWAEQRSTRAPKLPQQQLDNDENADEYEFDEDAAYGDDLDSKLPQMPRYSLFSQNAQPAIAADDSASDEDYSYEDDDSSNNSNKHPSIADGTAKTANKRNIFDWIWRKNKSKSATKVVPSTTAGYDKPSLEEADDSLDNDNDNDDDDDETGGYSNEQWNKIEHEHHLKQQKHQKELQALRQSSRNTPLIRADNEDADNIYSRNYIAGRLTRQKVEQLGTPEAVVKRHRQHAQQQAQERALATAHFNQILKEATCRVPQRRCERIQRDPAKIYTPHCTVLHRCSEDSGCCHSRTQVCAPKRTMNVDLHFFVKSKNQHRPITEKLTFVNHTECHCIERAKYEAEGGATAVAVQHATILSCTCPKLFEKILQEDGYCRCDCSSGNYGCDWLKRGSEHFSMNDRKCIQQGRCKPPTCEYGTYLDKHGRCPKQHEQGVAQQPSYNAMS